MGIIAIIDTFLVFKICQRLYNIPIALLASILFAVTPMTWLIRMITLDTIALPFLLTSILVSLNIVTWNKNENGNVSRHVCLVFLSGTCLGLAILTKTPLFIMIPLVAYLIYKNSNPLKGRSAVRSALKTLAIWLIPIILIPSVWPLYAISIGEFDLWQKGVLDQISRSRSEILETFIGLDSMLLFLGLGGLIYSVIRRDWFLIIWIVPFLIFVYTHGWFMYFHWIIVFPAFCIASAKFIFDLLQRVKSDKIKKSTALVIICAVISGIGFFNTFIIINQNLESGTIKAMAESLEYSDRADGLVDGKINEKITVVVPPEYSWIFKYIHGMNYAFDTHKDIGSKKIETNKTLLVQKGSIAGLFDNIKNKFSSFVLQFNSVSKICYIDIEWYKTDFETHSTLLMIPFKQYSSNNIVFEVNTSNESKNPERIDMKNTTARYINITLLPNGDNRIGAVSEIMIYGKKEENDDCKKIPIKIIKFRDRILNFNTLDNYDIIASYQKLLSEDKKKVSKYYTETHDLNDFTKLFAGFKFKWPPNYVTVMSNY